MYEDKVSLALWLACSSHDQRLVGLNPTTIVATLHPWATHGTQLTLSRVCYELKHVFSPYNILLCLTIYFYTKLTLKNNIQ
jgi:hypothetical protein